MSEINPELTQDQILAIRKFERNEDMKKIVIAVSWALLVIIFFVVFGTGLWEKLSGAPIIIILSAFLFLIGLAGILTFKSSRCPKCHVEMRVIQRRTMIKECPKCLFAYDTERPESSFF